MLISNTEIISFFSLIVSVGVALWNIHRDWPRKFIKKLKISNLQCNEEYGNKEDKSHGLSVFTVDMTSNLSDIVTLIHVSLIIKHNKTVKYLPIVGKSQTINPNETQTLYFFIYGLKYQNQIVQLPQPVLQISNDEYKHITELQKKWADHQQFCNTLHTRFHKSEDGINFLYDKIKESFGITNREDVLNVVKSIEFSMTFQTTLKPKLETMRYKPSVDNEKFAPFIELFEKTIKCRT